MFVVKNVNEFSLADHTRRIITLQGKESPQKKKKINQFHFISWPDKGVPGKFHGQADHVKK
jgi:protein tyrosine phosphatase